MAFAAGQCNDGFINTKKKETNDIFIKDDGTPLQFYMAPCPEKKMIREIINGRGGTLSSKSIGAVVRLTTNIDVADGQYVHTDFIIQSDREGRQLDIENYRIKRMKERIEAETDKKGQAQGRAHYSAEEDQMIVDFLRNYARAKGKWSIGGNEIWKKMAEEKVTLHSWQSMKDRYKKQLKSVYDVEKPVSQRAYLGKTILIAKHPTGLERQAPKEVSDSSDDEDVEEYFTPGSEVHDSSDDVDTEGYFTAWSGETATQHDNPNSVKVSSSATKVKSSGQNQDENVMAHKEYDHAQNVDDASVNRKRLGGFTLLELKERWKKIRREAGYVNTKISTSSDGKDTDTLTETNACVQENPQDGPLHIESRGLEPRTCGMDTDNSGIEYADSEMQLLNTGTTNTSPQDSDKQKEFECHMTSIKSADTRECATISMKNKADFAGEDSLFPLSSDVNEPTEKSYNVTESGQRETYPKRNEVHFAETLHLGTTDAQKDTEKKVDYSECIEPGTDRKDPMSNSMVNNIDQDDKVEELTLHNEELISSSTDSRARESQANDQQLRLQIDMLSRYLFIYEKIKDLAVKYNTDEEEVIRRLHFCSGKFDRLENSLLTGVTPWNLEEDKILHLQDKDAIKRLVERKGMEEISERVVFLEGFQVNGEKMVDID